MFHEQGGTEAQILKDGELMYGRRFEEGWQALQWAELEKEFIEKGRRVMADNDSDGRVLPNFKSSRPHRTAWDYWVRAASWFVLASTAVRMTLAVAQGRMSRLELLLIAAIAL
jgi:anti-sigma-K factor RskA